MKHHMRSKLAAAGACLAAIPAYAQVSYKDMADGLHAVLDADRPVYPRMVVKRLQKTRSGKILRGNMQKIADGMPWKMPATFCYRLLSGIL